MIEAIMDVLYMIFGAPPETMELIESALASIGGFFSTIVDFFSNLF